MTMTAMRKSVFFEANEMDNDAYEEWPDLKIRACPGDDDYPMEVTVDLGDGLYVGMAFNKQDIRRFIAEAYSTGAV